jgi:uncharacterized protein (TIGR04222 family)
MNPFDLRGPEFLLFYFVFSPVVIIAIVLLRRRAESGDAPRIDLGDPYLIAYLRGGADEALRVAVISLVDRGLLVMEGHLIRRADDVTSGMAKNQIEYEILKKFGDPGEESSVLDAAAVLRDGNLKSALHPYHDKLERAGLMPDAATRSARLNRLLFGLAVLGVVGVVKIQIGLSLGRPVGFLVVMMIAAMVIAAAVSFPRLTARGEATLEDVTNLYAGLRTQVNSMSPGSATAELAMVAAVFGIGALAATPFAYADDLFRRTRSDHSWFSGSSGSSCGSSGSSCGSSGSSCGSSGGGSSCGSSGCGGCGSS